MGDLIELTTTWPCTRNLFYKITSGGLAFEIKASQSGAAIGLSKKPGSVDVWVVIGYTRGMNHLTFIKRDSGRGKCIRTPNILNEQEYKRFWLLWGKTYIHLGQDNKRIPILTLSNNSDIFYFTLSPQPDQLGFHNFVVRRNTVHWRFELPPILGKPQTLQPVTCGELQWVHADNQLPDGALIGGYEKETLYIIRAPHQGSLTPGKFVPSHGLGYVAWGGEAREKSEFEVLCGFDCTWMPCFGNRIPVNAVEAGYSEDGKDKLYVGRALLNGHLIPGKVQPSHLVCYVPYEGREIANKKYEILVSPDLNTRCANKIFIEQAVVASPPESDSEDEDEDDDPIDEPYAGIMMVEEHL